MKLVEPGLLVTFHSILDMKQNETLHEQRVCDSKQGCTQLFGKQFTSYYQNVGIYWVVEIVAGPPCTRILNPCKDNEMVPPSTLLNTCDLENTNF